MIASNSVELGWAETMPVTRVYAYRGSTAARRRGVGYASLGNAFGIGAYSGQSPDPTQTITVTLRSGEGCRGTSGKKATADQVAFLDRCIAGSGSGCTMSTFRAAGSTTTGSCDDQLSVERQYGVAWDTIVELNTNGKCKRQPGQATDMKYARCVNWWRASQGAPQNSAGWFVFPARMRLKIPKPGTVSSSAPPLTPNDSTTVQVPSLPPSTTREKWWQRRIAGVPLWLLLSAGGVVAGAVVVGSGSSKKSSGRTIDVTPEPKLLTTGVSGYRRRRR